MQRRSLVILIVAIPALWLNLGESSGARPVKRKTWSGLQARADVIAIVSVTSTKDLPRDDGKSIQAQESRLRVLTVLKGDNVASQLRLLHFRYKRVNEGGPGDWVINACSYLDLKSTPGEELLQEQSAVVSNRANTAAGVNSLGASVSGTGIAAGAATAGFGVIEATPSNEGQYLMFLNRRDDGRMVPVTGDCDPDNSVFSLTKAGGEVWW